MHLLLLLRIALITEDTPPISAYDLIVKGVVVANVALTPSVVRAIDPRSGERVELVMPEPSAIEVNGKRTVLRFGDLAITLEAATYLTPPRLHKSAKCEARPVFGMRPSESGLDSKLTPEEKKKLDKFMDEVDGAPRYWYEIAHNYRGCPALFPEPARQAAAPQKYYASPEAFAKQTPFQPQL